MATPLLDDAFDSDTFRTQGHRLVDQLADYLARAARADLPVLRSETPARMLERYPAHFPVAPTLAPLASPASPASPAPHASPAPDDALTALIARVIDDSSHQHHPRYTGHQVTAPLPLGALCDLVAALLNNGMAAYEAGQAGVAMERAVLAWMAERVGFSSRADGVLTSGGTVGNLTALLAARQLKAGFDAWEDGLAGHTPLAVLVSDQAHYSIARAAQVMGMGAKGAIPVATDARFRVTRESLAAAHAHAEALGRRVIAVVANAGSTPTGAIDPLSDVADFCEARGLWMHVDGAHGASAAASSKYAAQLRGLSRADSLVWDAHKMLAMPSLVTAVLFRDGAHGYEAFAQRASYLFAPGDPREQWYNVGLRTLECTKRLMGLKLYAALTVLGAQVFDDYVTGAWDLARRFAGILRAREPEGFRLAVEPECNIVCFRYEPASVPASEWDALQDRVRARLVAEGRFFTTRTTLRGRAHLRTTLMNAFTRDEDLSALLDAVRDAASA